jgi:hypothetical protein
MPRVEEIKHRLRLDFETTAKQRQEESSRHPEDQRYVNTIKKLQIRNSLLNVVLYDKPEISKHDGSEEPR